MNIDKLLNSRFILFLLVVLQVAAFGILIWGPASERKPFVLIFIGAASVVTILKLLRSFKQGYSGEKAKQQR